MNGDWKKDMARLFFFEIQNLFLYLFYKRQMILFRHVCYYVICSHLLMILIWILKQSRKKPVLFAAALLYTLQVSMNFFAYGIVFGNLSARNINTAAYFANHLYFYCLVLLGMILWKGAKGIWISGTAVALLGLLNYHIYHFRGNVLSLLDIYSLRTAWNVRKNYGLLVNSDTVLFLTGMVCSMLVFSSICQRLGMDGTVHFQWGLIPAMLVMLWFVHSSIYLNACGVSAIYYEAGNNNGYYYNTVLKYMEGRQAVKSAPEDYSTDTLEEAFLSFGAESADRAETKPNVVVIMNESFSDFSVINEEIPFSEELTENLEWIRREAVWGNTYVSVFGGNTANSEYEFLTNDSMMYYPVGSVPYSVYIGSDLQALPEYFNELGYYTCAVHPYKASGWNRPSVYGYMNFQEMIFEDGFEDSERIRDYVSDAADYEKVFAILKEQEEPVFCFNITMQNHGGYEDTEKYDSKISIDGLDSQEAPQAETYLALAKESDRAIGSFLKELKEFDEPTVVVFFGDHQPGIEDAFYDCLYGKDSSELPLSEKIKQYTTPFFIWSNQGFEEQKIEKISLNYLSAVALEKAELPLTKYQSFLINELYPEYPVVTAAGIIDKYGNVMQREDLDSGLLQKYEQLIYNHIMDKNHTLNGVFSIRNTGGLP